MERRTLVGLVGGSLTAVLIVVGMANVQSALVEAPQLAPTTVPVPAAPHESE